MEQHSPFAQAIPDWLALGQSQGADSSISPIDLTPTPPAASHSVTAHKRKTKEAQEAAFLAMFERVLGEMVQGRTLKNIIEHDVRNIDYEAFFRWIKRDPVRSERYREAKELRTEWWAGRLVEIAEADDSTEDVARSRLRVDTLKWLMGADNRKTYGDTKQFEINQSISITAALEQARARISPIQTIQPIDRPIDNIVDVDTLGLIEHRDQQDQQDQGEDQS
jgi:hypothetical protein